MNPIDIARIVKIAMLLAKHGSALTQIITLIIALVNAIRVDLASAAPAGTFSTPQRPFTLEPKTLRAVTKAAKAGKRAEVKKLLTAALEG